MEPVIFFLAIGCILYIVYWGLRNDKAKSISDQQGLIRMRDHSSADEDSAPKAR